MIKVYSMLKSLTGNCVFYQYVSFIFVLDYITFPSLPSSYMDQCYQEPRVKSLGPFRVTDQKI